MSSTDDSQPRRNGWTEAGTISVWAWDRECRAHQERRPILLAVEEWEKAGLRGVHVIDIWAPDPAVTKPEEESDLKHDLEFWRDEDSGSWRFAELVEAGQLHYVGSLPAIPGYNPRQAVRAIGDHTEN